MTSAKQKVEELRGFRQSRAGLLLSIGSSIFGAFGVISDIRSARRESDALQLVNAGAAALALATSTALVVRELRRLT
ncbi:hypothetical protein ACEZCY_29710 [Streptacidiphilus sp. N1-12]|uniref:Uncharacterized protein n=2 Tax=Streptacidiphilus alkalitolerans TaxID=3342712 RepID=A0ABV6X6L3_9ACTN